MVPQLQQNALATGGVQLRHRLHPCLLEFDISTAPADPAQNRLEGVLGLQTPEGIEGRDRHIPSCLPQQSDQHIDCVLISGDAQDPGTERTGEWRPSFRLDHLVTDEGEGLRVAKTTEFPADLIDAPAQRRRQSRIIFGIGNRSDHQLDRIDGSDATEELDRRE